MKIAVTTKDGKNVNEYFELADSFFIYEISETRKRFIEKREASPYSARIENIRFKRNRFNKLLESIHDCSMLITHSIGEIPLQKLYEHGIETKIFNGPISNI